MELTYHGANCLKVTYRKNSLVVDDNLARLGLKSVVRDDDIVLFTNTELNDDLFSKKAKFVLDYPGEYEISNISIQGIPARAHTDENDKKNAIIYRIVIDDIRIVILGHIYPELSDEQLENIGTVDVLVVPIGGGGYTTDSTGALDLIRKISPKIIIPGHYDDGKIKYEVAQDKLEDVLKAISMEPSETVDVYKPKNLETIENARLIILEAQ